MWVVVPEVVLSRQYWLENNPGRRVDMERINNLDVDTRNALWARKVALHIWFLIPEEILVARTFCRDEWDVVYLDHMDYLVSLASTVGVKLENADLPLFYLRFQLLGRRWNIWNHILPIIQTINVWHNGGLFVPHDALDIDVNMDSLNALREIYPEIAPWFDALYFPAGVLYPAPIVLYYYYDRIRLATGVERGFWQFILRAEFALIFTACWWHQAERGQRAFIVPVETIEWLGQYLERDTPIDGDTNNDGQRFTTVGWVLDRMTEVLDPPSHLVHVVRFNGTYLPNSYFVMAIRGTGYMDRDAENGLPWYYSSSNGRLYVDIRRMGQEGDVRTAHFRNTRNDYDRQWHGAQRMARNRANRDPRLLSVASGRITSGVRPVHIRHPRREHRLADQMAIEPRLPTAPPSPRLEHQPPPRLEHQPPPTPPSRQQPLVGPSTQITAPTVEPAHTTRPSPEQPAGSSFQHIMRRAVEGDAAATQNLHRAVDYMQNVVYNVDRMSEAYRQHQRMNPPPASTAVGPSGLFGTGRIPGRNSNFVLRPFQYWNTDSLRNYVRQLLRQNGNPNPSDGQVNSLANMMANMRGYDA